MKKSIKDKIKEITDSSAGKSYAAMEKLKLSLNNNGLTSGGAYEEQMAKGCSEIIEKDYLATLIDILNRIEKLNVRLSDDDITYLVNTFDTFSKDLIILMKRRISIDDLTETTKLLIQTLSENLSIILQNQINDYKFINENKRLAFSDKLGFWSLALSAAGLIIGILSILITFYKNEILYFISLIF